MERKDALGGLLKRIGNFDPSDFSSDFNDRLILQKTIYLMEQFGLNIGYDFSWYLRGPYSPTLAKDAYAMAKTYSSIPVVRFADTEKERKFFQFLAFIKPFSRKYSDLEKIASTLFLHKAYRNLSTREIHQNIKAKIPSVSVEEIREIETLLRSQGLLETDK